MSISDYALAIGDLVEEAIFESGKKTPEEVVAYTKAHLRGEYPSITDTDVLNVYRPLMSNFFNNYTEPTFH